MEAGKEGLEATFLRIPLAGAGASMFGCLMLSGAVLVDSLELSYLPFSDPFCCVTVIPLFLSILTA